MRISGWSSDVCSSDLLAGVDEIWVNLILIWKRPDAQHSILRLERHINALRNVVGDKRRDADPEVHIKAVAQFPRRAGSHFVPAPAHHAFYRARVVRNSIFFRSEEHASELQSIMRISYAG